MPFNTLFSDTFSLPFPLRAKDPDFPPNRTFTVQHDSEEKTADVSNSGDVGFQSRPGDQPFCPKTVFTPFSLSKKAPGC
jgi:hypothetical protein